MKMNADMVGLVVIGVCMAIMLGFMSWMLETNIKTNDRAHVECGKPFTTEYDVCRHKILLEVRG
jgi:hypothetical protein